MLDHITSDFHKVAMARLRVDSVRARGGSVVLAGRLRRLAIVCFVHDGL